ncbi:FAD-dependent monooxygenase [Amycolatopsis sp. NPDC088138]|uniref:FAD-dependent monooxygenase n=1 Tax=Amycolatopsis sp. NPDC088138 TaxID=3363938 RepID=UPI00381361E4
MTTRTPVVIVGAGPCGLTLACELMSRGAAVRVLEAEPGPHRGSRAILLWPPALRIFGELGILPEAERRGQRVRSMHYHLPGGRRLDVPLGPPDAALLLPQEQTGELLEAALVALGGKVERATTVTDVADGRDAVRLRASGPGGDEVIEADWLVGADGVRSTVRARLGIGFPGARVGSTLLLAEGRIDGALPPGGLHYFLGAAGSLVFAPMGPDRVRVSAAVSADVPLTAQTVQDLLDERGPGGLRVSELAVITTFGSSERVASRLRSGRCFLVGDAAHTHSPLGGQGLNLGLQDVHNLGWKLAGVLDGRFDERVLASYEPERRHAAERVVRTTSLLLKLFMVGPALARARNAAWRALGSVGLLTHWFAPLLAGGRTRYPDVLPGARPRRRRGIASAALPRPGTRAPAWVPDAPAGARFRLLTTGSPNGSLARAASATSDLVAREHVPRRGRGFVLLRPDGYVAASGVTTTDLGDAMRRIVLLSPASE